MQANQAIKGLIKGSDVEGLKLEQMSTDSSAMKKTKQKHLQSVVSVQAAYGDVIMILSYVLDRQIFIGVFTHTAHFLSPRVKV